MFAPPRTGFKAHRTKFTARPLPLASSIRRINTLSNTSSVTSHASPAVGVTTRSTWPTPVTQLRVLQGHVASWFQRLLILVPYFSTVISLSGQIFHCVLYAALHIMALKRLQQYSL